MHRSTQNRRLHDIRYRLEMLLYLGQHCLRYCAADVSVRLGTHALLRAGRTTCAESARFLAALFRRKLLALRGGKFLQLPLTHRLEHALRSAFQRRLRSFALFRRQSCTSSHLLLLGFCGHIAFTSSLLVPTHNGVTQYCFGDGLTRGRLRAYYCPYLRR